MMTDPKIQYIDREGNEISPRAFLESLYQGQIETESLYEFIRQMDYTGCVRLDESDYIEALETYPKDIRRVLNELPIKRGSNVFLRGRKYHLDVINQNDTESIRSDVIDNLEFLSQIDIQVHESPRDMSGVQKALHSSILDHNKHYAMIMLFAIYTAMIDDSSIRKEDFLRARSFCENAIRNYYSFVVKGETPTLELPDQQTIELFNRIELPKDKIDSHLEKGGRKLVHRDLDHPGQIIFYAGNLLQNDESFQSIDLIVNPLFGSIELGFGLKSMYHLMGVEKIEDIQFIRYSRYGEKHKKEIEEKDMQKYIPTVLRPDLEAVLDEKDNRVVIMDDGIFRGNTLLTLQNYLRKRYSRPIGLAAVEITPEKSFINQHDLITPAIAIRSVIPIPQIIHEKLGQ